MFDSVVIGVAAPSSASFEIQDGFIGTPVTFIVEGSVTLDALIAEYSDMFGVSPDESVWSFKGNLMESDAQLSDYRIKDGSKIDISLLGCGGATKKCNLKLKLKARR